MGRDIPPLVYGNQKEKGMATKSYAHPRIFIGGFEVTSLVKNVRVDLPRDDLGTVLLELVAIPTSFEDDCIFIGELPKDEFMAEMVRIKLRREGVMSEKGCDKNKA